MGGFCIGGAGPAGGLGEEGELASARRRKLLVICEVEIKERPELDRVAGAGLESKVDGKVVVGGLDGAGWRCSRRVFCEQAESEEGRVEGVHGGGVGEEDERRGRVLYLASIERDKQSLISIPSHVHTGSAQPHKF